MIKKILAALLLAGVLAGCGQAPAQQSGTAPADGAAQTGAVAPAYETGLTTRVVSLKGPTSMGLVKLMNDEEGGEHYTFAMYTGADEIVPLLVKGEADIALVPANLAATLYQKTEGQLAAIGLNTLSVLDVVTADEAVQSVADLKGKTVYMTGKGTTPEYALRYVVQKSGLTMDDLAVEFKTEATEVVSAITEDASAVGVLPQPFATVAVTQNEALKTVLHLGDVWAASADDGSQLVTGVTIARREFLDAHPGVVLRFLEDQASSVDYVNANLDDAAALVEQYGIVKAPVAKKAIPSCNLVSITGSEMQAALSGYLQALYDMAPDTVGGKVPDEAFYYLGA